LPAQKIAKDGKKEKMIQGADKFLYLRWEKKTEKLLIEENFDATKK